MCAAHSGSRKVRFLRRAERTIFVVGFLPALGVFLMLAGCGPLLPSLELPTSLLIRGGAEPAVLYCRPADVEAVSLSVRERGVDGEWGDYRLIVSEDVRWQTGPASPLPLAPLEVLNTDMQVSMSITGTREGKDLSVVTVIEITEEMRVGLTSGEWINAFGVVESPCETSSFPAGRPF